MLLETLRDLLDRNPAELSDLLGEAIYDDVCTAFQGHIDHWHADACTVAGSSPTEADWRLLWEPWPNKVDELKAKRKFFALPWSEAFAVDLYEGRDRHILACKLLKQPCENLFFWLYHQRWTDRPCDKSQRPIVGDSERRRLALSRTRQGGQLAAILAAKMPFPEAEPPPDNRTVLEIYRDALAEGKPRNAGIEALFSHKELASIGLSKIIA